ncbi:hypothetical protein TCAP_07522 [Tolypocladium capitatum]
MGGT